MIDLTFSDEEEEIPSTVKPIQLTYTKRKVSENDPPLPRDQSSSNSRKKITTVKLSTDLRDPSPVDVIDLIDSSNVSQSYQNNKSESEWTTVSNWKGRKLLTFANIHHMSSEQDSITDVAEDNASSSLLDELLTYLQNYEQFVTATPEQLVDICCKYDSLENALSYIIDNHIENKDFKGSYGMGEDSELESSSMGGKVSSFVSSTRKSGSSGSCCGGGSGKGGGSSIVSSSKNGKEDSGAISSSSKDDIALSSTTTNTSSDIGSSRNKKVCCSFLDMLRPFLSPITHLFFSY